MRKPQQPNAEDAKDSQRPQKNIQEWDFSASSANFCAFCVRLLGLHEETA